MHDAGGVEVGERPSHGHGGAQSHGQVGLAVVGGGTAPRIVRVGVGLFLMH